MTVIHAGCLRQLLIPTLISFRYTTDDAENPQNFSRGKKAVVTLHICLYTMAVYMSSSIYSPSSGGVSKEFHVSLEVASFGLSLYVLAYGIGPLVRSCPLEIFMQ